MTVWESVRLANELLHKHSELNMWDVTTNNRKHAFGLCGYHSREIQLSEYLIPFMSEEAIRNTIIHEIAHALTKGHSHDNVWRRKCIELGGDGKRVGGKEKYEDGGEAIIEYRKTRSKYTLTCPCCGHISFLERRPKRSYSCGKHVGGYNEKYKMILTQNF